MAQETTREDQASVSLTVDGKQSPSLFQKRSGGKIGSEGSKTAPGGMLPKVAHGGIVDIEDLTLEGEFVPSRDNGYIQWLKTRIGKGRINAAEELLDVDGNVIETIDRWTGSLSSLDTGNYDATSSTPRSFVIMAEVDGNPG
jgi:hypothetical protein